MDSASHYLVGKGVTDAFFFFPSTSDNVNSFGE